MSRIDVTETTVYKFSELSEEAKETARQWWRDYESQNFGGFGELFEPAETAAKLLGIEFDTRTVPLMSGKTRQEPEILWSGFSSQGDGASFTGRWEYRKGSKKAVRAEFGTDEKLWKIADELTEFARKHGWKVEGKVTRRDYSHYVHANTMRGEAFDREGEELSEEASEEFTELMRDFANWIYRGLEREYDYRMSDENVDESIEANEYEFTEGGKIYD